MGWREWLKGKNQPGPGKTGGAASQNTGGNRHGRSNNAAKQKPKKRKGNTGK